MKNIDSIFKVLFRVASGNNRKYYNNQLKKIAKNSNDKTVLEIGSGKQVNGRYPYSSKEIFSGCKKFIQTDINPRFGHKVLDITRLNESNKYDVILCMNVLEHVYDYRLALKNLHKSLKKNGTLVIVVPFAFPLHDEPYDFWRFTEHSLRKELYNFREVRITAKKLRKLPTGYYVTAIK